MLRSGDWWTPRLHHEVPHYTKPPLTYWAIAGSLELFGRFEGAARLPNSVAFFATILLVARMARRLAPGAETTAGLVYSTSLLPFVAANIVTTDTLLVAGVALGLSGFIELAFGEGPAARERWFLWGGFGLAFLTKGPPGLLLLLALLALSAFEPELRDKVWRGPRRLASIPSLLLFGLLAFTWFAHEIARRPDLLGYLVGDEVVARVGSEAFDRNPGWRGWLRAYGPVLLAGMLPWWPLALLAARRRRRTGDGPRDGGFAAARLLALLLLLPLAIFSFSQSRQPLYLLPLTAPAALLVARGLGPIGLTPRGRAAIVAWAACLLAVKGLAAVWPTPRDGRRFATELLARLPYPPGELLFVEERARYSLALYLDCEIERIDLESIELRPREPSYRPLDEKLAQELAEDEPARVYLVPLRAEAAFEREVSALGRRSRRVGELDRFAIHLDPLPTP